MCVTHFCTFVAYASRRVFDTAKRLSKLRVSHLVMVGASLLYCLAIFGLISIHFNIGFFSRTSCLNCKHKNQCSPLYDS